MTFHNSRNLLLLFIALIVFIGQIFPPSAACQRVVAQVNTILKTLPIEKQEKLADFHDKVTHYINSYDWHNNPYDGGQIDVDMTIMLEDISTSSEERYKATFQVTNKYDIQIFDKRCRFAYRSGELVVHENAINSLTALLDYFIYLIIGGEFDKYGTLEGTPYYEKARDIAQQAKFQLSRYDSEGGWDLRNEQINYILSKEHQKFREMVDYYYYGISLIESELDKAREYCAEAVRMLDKILEEDPKNEYCKNFISSHHAELINLYKNAQDKTVLKKLMILDPDNAESYRENL